MCFTVVEMLVVVAIIGILAALLMPSLSRALTTARVICCQNGLRQIGSAASIYANDYGSVYPPYMVDFWNSIEYNKGKSKRSIDNFWKKLTPYTLTGDLAQCPLSSIYPNWKNYWLKGSQSRSSYWYQFLDGTYYKPETYSLIRSTRPNPSKKGVAMDYNSVDASAPEGYPGWMNNLNNHADSNHVTETQSLLYLDNHVVLLIWPKLYKRIGLGF